MEFGIIHEHFGDTFGVELSCNLKSGVPVLFMLVHIDCFLRFVSLDKFFFSLLKSIFILKMQGILKMNFWKLILGVRICKSKCLIEFFLIGFKINSCFN